jgi:hypothetical protein
MFSRLQVKYQCFPKIQLHINRHFQGDLIVKGTLLIQDRGLAVNEDFALWRGG